MVESHLSDLDCDLLKQIFNVLLKIMVEVLSLRTICDKDDQSVLCRPCQFVFNYIIGSIGVISSVDAPIFTL